MSVEGRLRRARRTLRSIARYCKTQKECAEAGIISSGQTWQKVYQDVNGMLSGWADTALKESTKKREVI